MTFLSLCPSVWCIGHVARQPLSEVLLNEVPIWRHWYCTRHELNSMPNEYQWKFLFFCCNLRQDYLWGNVVLVCGCHPDATSAPSGEECCQACDVGHVTEVLKSDPVGTHSLFKHFIRCYGRDYEITDIEPLLK